MTKPKRQLLKYITLFLVISGVLYLLSQQVNQEQIVQLVQNAGIFGPLIFILILTTTYIAAPLSGTPIYLAGFVLFKNEFIVYNHIAASISAVINFWIARKWGRKPISKLIGQKNMEKIDLLTSNYGTKSLIFLRLFQGNLYDFISYAYGLTKINFRSYFIISIITPLPWTILWQYYLIDRIHNLVTFTLALAISLVPFAIITLLLFKKLNSKSIFQKSS